MGQLINSLQNPSTTQKSLNNTLGLDAMNQSGVSSLVSLATGAADDAATFAKQAAMSQNAGYMNRSMLERAQKEQALRKQLLDYAAQQQVQQEPQTLGSAYKALRLYE